MDIVRQGYQWNDCPSRRLYFANVLGEDDQRDLEEMIGADCLLLCARSEFVQGLGRLPCKTVESGIQNLRFRRAAEQADINYPQSN